MRFDYNTIFHSQIDEQTKHQNQILEQYSRCYVNYQQNDRVFWLSMTKYVYNNSRHSVTRIFSFESLFEKTSRWINIILDKRFNIETSTIKERVRKTTKKRA
jgi:hypothetical protein